MSAQKKFGTFSGVLTPSLLTILGVIMYMRLGTVVGYSSQIFEFILIIVFAHLISVTTGLSVSSISTDKKIVYIGRLAKSKNIELLIKAFSKLKTTNVNLIIAGPDFGMLKELNKITKEHGLVDRVHFTGWISEEEKIKLLSETTIFVHPSLEDVFLLSLLEAAAIGIPCVAFDVESNSTILEDNKTGIIVKDISSEGLSQKLDLLLNDNNLYDKISKNSKLILPKKFNWELTTKILENFYYDVVKS